MYGYISSQHTSYSQSLALCSRRKRKKRVVFKFLKLFFFCCESVLRKRVIYKKKKMGSKEEKKIRGKVVLMKSNVLGFNDFEASFVDRLYEFVGKRVSLQLLTSSLNAHPCKSLSLSSLYV